MAGLVGIDRGGGAHAVCVIDTKEQVLDRFAVGHNRAGLETLVARLRKHGAASADQSGEAGRLRHDPCRPRGRPGAGSPRMP